LGQHVTRHSIAAFAVHILTAAGAALALLALLAAVRAEWAAMFAWLGMALFIDGIDGTLARALRTVERVPRFSGDVLDLVVDFTTYVFVPAYALAAGGLLPQPAGIPLALVVVVTGALYFADRQMKTADNFFRGFPALWNVAAFYLFVVKPAPWAGAAAVAALAALTFAPFDFVHPVRVMRLRTLNIAALVLWALLAVFAVTRDLDPGPWPVAALCALAVYFLAIGLWRPRRQDR
jgi:phosphatidylcholine synthase